MATNPIDVYVGKRLRLCRIKKGFSQNIIAKQLGITFQQFQKYESGKNRISSSRLYDISQILNTKISYFFDGYEEQDIFHEIKSNGYEKNESETEYDKKLYNEIVKLVKNYENIKDKKQRKIFQNIVVNFLRKQEKS